MQMEVLLLRKQRKLFIIMNMGFVCEVAEPPSASKVTVYVFAFHLAVNVILKDTKVEVIDNNTKLYAQWENNQYTISFDPNQGLVEPEKKSIV